MNFDTTSDYDVPPDALLRAFCDPAFHEAKLAALGLVSYHVLEQKMDADAFRIRIERVVPLDAPALLRKLVPTQTRAVSEERWEAAQQRGTVRIEPVGIPVDMSCQAQVSGDTRSCRITYTWTVRARVPLVGGALEKFIAADMQTKMRDETRAAQVLLARWR